MTQVNHTLWYFKIYIFFKKMSVQFLMTSSPRSVAYWCASWVCTVKKKKKKKKIHFRAIFTHQNWYLKARRQGKSGNTNIIFRKLFKFCLNKGIIFYLQFFFSWISRLQGFSWISAVDTRVLFVLISKAVDKLIFSNILFQNILKFIFHIWNRCEKYNQMGRKKPSIVSGFTDSLWDFQTKVDCKILIFYNKL